MLCDALWGTSRGAKRGGGNGGPSHLQPCGEARGSAFRDKIPPHMVLQGLTRKHLVNILNMWWCIASSGVLWGQGEESMLCGVWGDNLLNFGCARDGGGELTAAICNHGQQSPVNVAIHPLGPNGLQGGRLRWGDRGGEKKSAAVGCCCFLPASLGARHVLAAHARLCAWVLQVTITYPAICWGCGGLKI